MYTSHTHLGTVTRDSDGKIIAPTGDTISEDFRAYARYCADGGAVAVDDESRPGPTLEDFEAAVQAHLDAAAQARGWDSIYTAALRASFAGPYQDEGLAFAQWMDACWQRCHVVMSTVAAGLVAAPESTDALIVQLPAAPSFG